MKRNEFLFVIFILCVSVFIIFKTESFALNKKARLIRMETRDSHGDLVRYKKYFYKPGMKKIVWFRKADNNIKKYLTQEIYFNSDKQLKQTIEYNPDHYSNIKYEYNDMGQKIKQTEYDKKGRLIKQTGYLYNPKNDKIVVTDAECKEQLFRIITETETPDHSRFIRVDKTVRGDGKTVNIRKLEYTYNSEKKYIYRTSESSLSRFYEKRYFDSNNNSVLRITREKKGNRIHHIKSYVYDSQNRIIQSSDVYEKDRIVILFFYEYDQSGRPRSNTEVIHEDGKSRMLKTSYIYENI